METPFEVTPESVRKYFDNLDIQIILDNIDLMEADINEQCIGCPCFSWAR